jgi:hypothetical protein
MTVKRKPQSVPVGLFFNHKLSKLQLYFVGTFKSTFPSPLGMYVTFGFPASDCTIALLASIFRSATNASPAFSSAFEIVSAASASPSARITAACRSWSAYEAVRSLGLSIGNKLAYLFHNKLCPLGV